jgi:hypothetical protein
MRRMVGTVGVALLLTVAGSSVADATGDLVVRPPRIRFGARIVGTESAPRKVTLTNGTDQPIAVYAVGVGAGFRIVSLSCFDGPLTPGRRCSVRVSFSPTASGEVSSALRIQYCFIGIDPLCPGALPDQVRFIDVPLAGRGR